MTEKKTLRLLDEIMIEEDMHLMEKTSGSYYLYHRDKTKLRLGRYFEEGYDIKEYVNRFKQICKEKDGN